MMCAQSLKKVCFFFYLSLCRLHNTSLDGELKGPYIQCVIHRRLASQYSLAPKSLKVRSCIKLIYVCSCTRKKNITVTIHCSYTLTQGLNQVLLSLYLVEAQYKTYIHPAIRYVQCPGLRFSKYNTFLADSSTIGSGSVLIQCVSIEMQLPQMLTHILKTPAWWIYLGDLAIIHRRIAGLIVEKLLSVCSLCRDQEAVSTEGCGRYPPCFTVYLLL